MRISDWSSDVCSSDLAEFAPLDFVALLEERTEGTAGWPHVTRWLARRTGHALVRLPQGGTDENGLRDSVMIITRELGDTAAALTEALTPGSPGGVTVTPAESSDGGRVGKECVRKGKSVWSQSQ